MAAVRVAITSPVENPQSVARKMVLEYRAHCLRLLHWLLLLMLVVLTDPIRMLAPPRHWLPSYFLVTGCSLAIGGSLLGSVLLDSMVTGCLLASGGSLLGAVCVKVELVWVSVGYGAMPAVASGSCKEEEGRRAHRGAGQEHTHTTSPRSFPVFPYTCLDTSIHLPVSLTWPQTEEIREAFNLFDADQSGASRSLTHQWLTSAAPRLHRRTRAQSSDACTGVRS